MDKLLSRAREFFRKKKDTFPPEALLCAGIALLVAIVFSYAIFPHIPGSQDRIYLDRLHELALNLSSGKGYVFAEGGPPVFYWRPMYILFLAGIYKVFGPSLWLVQLFHSIFYALTVLILYVIAETVFDRRVALISALLLAIFPHALWHIPVITINSFYMFMMAILAFCLVKYFQNPSLRNGLLVGISLGMASLTKGVTTMLPVPLLAVMLMLYWRRRKEIVSSWVMMILCLGLAMSPWMVRNYLVSKGHIMLGYGWGSSYFGSIESFKHDPSFIPNKSVRELEKYWLEQKLRLMVDYNRNRPLWKRLSKEDLVLDGGQQNFEWWVYLDEKASEDLIRNPLRLLHKMLWQVPRFWYLSYSSFNMKVLKVMNSLIWFPALFGMFFAIKNRKEVYAIIFLILYFTGIHTIAVALAGHSVPIMPFIIMLAVYGILSAVKAMNMNIYFKQSWSRGDSYLRKPTFKRVDI